jgi:hypothetical protein
MRRVLLTALAAAVIALATAASSSAGSQSATFQTPSKRIHCIYFSPPAFLRCDIDTGLRPAPPRPAGCDLEWGQGLQMGRTGRSRVVCAGDTAKDPGAPVIGYGKTWKRGGFTCTVRRTGLRCTNAAGHGFFLSAERWERF